ncbi:MAG: extracellular solute-binding protein [Clostridiaceae bacterium]|nr:extracellular solute-binding protein [Clostridiaceae bacterium]
MKRTIAARIAAMFLAGGLMMGTAACGSKSQPQENSLDAAGEPHEEVTISILHEHSAEAAENIVSSAGFRAMLDKYQEEHPWVHLEETTVSNSEILNKYLALIAADELPDVTYVKYTWLENMVENNMLVDLTEYVNPDDYVDGLYSVTYDGKVWGMPNKHSAYNLILYNKKMWKEAGYDTFPATMEEFIKAGEVFKEKGITAVSFGNTAKWNAVSYFTSPLLYDYCGKEWVESMIAQDGKAKWTDDCFIQAMEELQKMSILFNEDFNMQDDMWAMGWYMQGNAAAHAVGTWGIDTAKNMSEEYKDVWDNTGVAILPAANGANPTLVSAVGAAVGVSSKLEGAEREAAIELVKQISSQDYARFMSERASTTPVKTDLDFTGKGPQYEEFAEVLNTPDSGLNFNDYFNQGIANLMQAETQSLLAGNNTPEEMAQKLQAFQDQL